MKKRIVLPAVLALAFAVASVFVIGFGNKAENENKTECETNNTLLTYEQITASTAVAYEETSVVVTNKEVTEASSFAETTTAATTKAVVTQTAAPTKAAKTEKAQDTEFSSFNNVAFLGNSRFVSVKDNKLAPNVYPVVGLDVRTVFTKHVNGSDVAVIDELDGRSFDAVVLLFGENECGWPNQDYFIKKYSEVIDAVKAKQPDAQIYLHAIIPVSAEASAQNNCGCNNETISELNERIKQLASDYNVEFIDVPPCLLDAHGNLIDGAASDGIHLNRKYASLWMSYLEETVF